MFDPILSVAVVAFVATPVILYFLILDRPEQHSDAHRRGERGAFPR